MNEIGAILTSAQRLLPPDVQGAFVARLGTTDTPDASPAGVILMAMHILEYLGFPRYIDELLGEEHTTIEQLRNQYNNRIAPAKDLIPSTGIIVSLMVSDMIACSRKITPAYRFEEMAQQWRTGPLLGIEPSVLNDDRIGRALSILGMEAQNMEDVLYSMVLDAARKAGIPLNKFILDTTILELDGKFKDAAKVVPGRGTNSFAQLIVSLVIASGSRIPVGCGVLAGNTSDANTLPGVYETVHRIAEEGSVEFLMDRIYPTPSNILFLKEHEAERMVYWVSPLKMGLSEKRVRYCIDQAYLREQWQPINYRSTKEIKAQTAPPLTAFETTWTLTETIKPDLQPGQTRRPRGSVQTIEIEVRCVFYRHAVNAKREKENRERKIDQLEKALQEFCTKLNKRHYQTMAYCQKKLSELLKSFACVKDLLQCHLFQTDQGAILLTWSWDPRAIEEECKYDGIFALLTNYTKKQIVSNQLVTKYRSRDQIEMDFKEMKGLLDLERVLYHRPERIESYVFLKVIAFFVLAFLRSYAEQEGIKTTEKKIQESLGDMLLIENKILPLGMKTYAIARDTELNKWLRKNFSLPEPTELIQVLNATETAQIDGYIRTWHENLLKAQHTL